MARRVRFWGGAWWPGIQTNASAQVTDVAESSDQWILRQREDGDEKEKTLGDHGKFAEVPRLASVFFYCLIPEGLRGRGQTIWFQRGGTDDITSHKILTNSCADQTKAPDYNYQPSTTAFRSVKSQPKCEVTEYGYRPSTMRTDTHQTDGNNNCTSSFFLLSFGRLSFYVPLSSAINLVIFLSKSLFIFSGLHSLSVENSPLRLTVTITQCCWFSLRFNQNLRLRLTTWGGHRLSRQPADNR